MQFGKTVVSFFKKTQRLVPALRLVWRSSPGWTMAKLSLLVVQGLRPLLQIYLIKLVVDIVTTESEITASLDLLNQSKPLLIGLAVVLLFGMIANALSELVTTAQAQKVSDYMRSILHAKSIEIDLSYYENPRYHDTLQRAQKEATYRPNQILKRLALVVENGILLVAMMGLLLTLHWGITGTLLVAIIPTVLMRLRYTRKLYNWQRTWTPVERKSMYLSWLLTGDQFAKEIRLFGLGDLFSQRFDDLRSQLYRAKLKLMTWRSLSFLAANMVTGVMIGAIYGFILYQALQGVLKLGDLVLYHQALQRGQSGLKSFMAGLSGLHEDNLFLTNLYEFLDLRPQIVTPAQPKFCPSTKEQGITFENVSFQYEGTSRQALKDLSFSIKPGETIALVGENGSGKTTLIKLLCRLYDPTGGRITFNGIDLRDLDVDHLRQQISVVFQDYAKYHLSAQDNIWLGDVQLSPQDGQVIAAAKKAGAHEVISQLPDGYDTMLGKLFHGGEELSIGQWQKVALARAFLRQSQVIVLDEPTSAMDPKAEYELFTKFRELIQDQSAILITHRLSTVKMADRIYVMDKGRLIENGTHQELMACQGTYAHLFETQAKNYL
ncbi:xenobiotic-transporting atpase [Leptolyngbya sp. Heron Island J]|uniref:ABC transporter ATP-binding protein n=1 Tax=Leptolyngbya sp. Heron Island J TaxID=1385935 RepID=UPI0003B9C144|nr:ABC transporter ATP-binding protein [Leptolyngbya sp. Heron Island J]ESA34079.1 xenobiotic-transporting atpase [Leptolyngbya sp. Heron Island J]